MASYYNNGNGEFVSAAEHFGYKFEHSWENWIRNWEEFCDENDIDAERAIDDHVVEYDYENGSWYVNNEADVWAYVREYDDEVPAEDGNEDVCEEEEDNNNNDREGQIVARIDMKQNLKVYAGKLRQEVAHTNDKLQELFGNKDVEVSADADVLGDYTVTVSVNWASIGTVTPEKAAQFADQLEMASFLADTFPYAGWTVTFDEDEDMSGLVEMFQGSEDERHWYYDPDWQLRYVTEEEVEEYEQNGTFKAYDDEVPAEEEEEAETTEKNGGIVGTIGKNLKVYEVYAGKLQPETAAQFADQLERASFLAEEKNADVCDMWSDYPSYEEMKKIADMMIEDGETSVRIRLAADSLQCTYDGVALSRLQSASPLPRFIYTTIRNCYVLRFVADLVYDYEQHMETVELLKSCGCYKDDDNAEGRE